MHLPCTESGFYQNKTRNKSDGSQKQRIKFVCCYQYISTWRSGRWIDLGLWGEHGLGHVLGFYDRPLSWEWLYPTGCQHIEYRACYLLCRRWESHIFCKDRATSPQGVTPAKLRSNSSLYRCRQSYWSHGLTPGNNWIMYPASMLKYGEENGRKECNEHINDSIEIEKS